MRSKTALQSLLLPLVLLLGPACQSLDEFLSIPAWKGDYARASVLVLPPKDATQRGRFHHESSGSGRVLMNAVAGRLREAEWTVMETEGAGFSHEVASTAEQAVAEAKRLGATYALVLELGEFRNAEADSFYKDFASLAKGSMFATASGQPVWRLEEPLQSTISNKGSHLRLIQQFGIQVADSIAKEPQPSAPR